jgi:asparagine synthase (glutamine-hydrolysing)
MCGIAGIVNFSMRDRVEENRLIRMRDVQRHRGPDGAGLWSDGPVGFAHRRLAIVDVKGGHQPMANEDESVWIVFNGEIYNHSELRPKLEAKGHRYQTRSDTETILHLYEEEGDRCVERLHGMFAFALWDRGQSRLLLARDRLGIKPLYYACTDHELLFASEIKGILAAEAFRPEFNEEILPEFLASRFVAGEETFFRRVRKLLPGHTLSWSTTEGFRERRYWCPPVRNDRSSVDIEERGCEVRAKLESAVSSHLMSDVPVGLFLSGGLDSTALAALMTSASQSPVHAFSVGFSETEANELPYAQLAARSVGAEYHEVLVSPQQFFQALPRLVWHEDEPIAFNSSVPLYFVSRLAQQHVKVVLTGEGADELFLGYDYRYRVTELNERLGRLYWAATPETIRGGVARMLGVLPRGIRRYAERSFLAYPPGPRGVFFDNFSVFPAALRREVIKERGALTSRDPHAHGLRYWDEHREGFLERMSYVDLQTHLVELLMKQDQMSMAASIESRVPYLDHELVDMVGAMPGQFRLHGWETKAVLRNAVRHLIPQEILKRPKMGFPVPLGRWLQGPYWPTVKDLILGPRALARGLFNQVAIERLVEEHRSGHRVHTDRLWLLMNLELWHRVFLDGEDPGADSYGSMPEVAAWRS